MRVIPATPDLIPFLMARMSERQWDVIRADGEEALTSALKADVAAAAHALCAVDEGGPVILFLVFRPAAGLGARLAYYAGDDCTRPHLRQIIRLWRRAAVEALAGYGALVVDVPPWVSNARRMRRMGFTVNPPGLDEGGTMVCRCEAVAQWRPPAIQGDAQAVQ